MTRYLLLGATFAFAAAVQPGPLLTYLISQTITKGWRRTLPAALAPLLSDGPIIALVLLVLTQIPVWLVNGLHFAGGFFLLFLAYKACTTWRDFEAAQAAAAQTKQRSLLQATFVNLLNPAPYLGWSLVMGPLLLQGWQESPSHGIALLAGFYTIMVLSLAGIILLFGAARTLGPRVNRALIGLSAIALAGFGVYQLWLGFQTLGT